ncbi:phage GP46 family protein [Burkholderia sp. B21-005]|uniref:phage GP46 family protein n=1 Tax=Burkholderia sp. B21-005 TaxID=2890406 RepID=UPI001E5F262E|nr:phage GP46 family protein [Burkholderia sp. B21-005]UEP42765.1 phage GP46 family protein [Burkholderia sp. B21-005]
MSDISVIWDAANSRGDWSFQPLTVAGQVINVSAPSTFGIGDGVSTLFQLSATQGRINGIISAQLYRNDWQGNQLLYATPRTNSFLQSANLASASWVRNNVASLAAATGPDGSSNAYTLTSTSSGFGFVYQSLSVTIGVPVWVSIFAKAGSTNSFRMVSNTQAGSATFTLSGAGSASAVSGVFSNATIVTLDGVWYCCSVLLTPTATGTNTIIPADITTASASVTFFGPQYGSAGGYIPTTTAPVTVTDYTLTPTGSAALSVPPAVAAALTWTGSYVSDTVSGGDLATGLDLETAVLVSLFTDRMANRDDPIPDGTDDPRGWWGDIGEDKPIGSRLWLLDRSKQTQEVLNNARDYIFEALQWLVDDGVVASIDVQTQWVRDTFLGAQVTLYQPTGQNVSMAYAWAWNQLS